MIQYSGGTLIDASFTSDGTRQQLVSQLETQLVNAGWTVVSGAGSADVLIQSAVTPTGQKIRMRMFEPGGANLCAQFFLKSDVVTSAALFLLPVNGSMFRILASKYQFIYFLSTQDTSKQRALIMGGVPYIPDWLVNDLGGNPWLGWLHGNGTTDTGTTPLSSTMRAVVTVGQTTGPQIAQILQGPTTYAIGAVQAVFGLMPVQSANGADACYGWRDGTYRMVEPLLLWPIGTSGGITANVAIQGQMWDSIVSTKTYVSEVVRSFEGHNWRNITHIAGLTAPAGQRGCLFHAIT